MKYFNSLPKVVYTDKNNIRTVYTNLMARASITPTILNNILVYYDYDVQDEDTPEIIAYKYYGDINRFWIVLYCNQLLNPQWDWPLSSNKFEKYVTNKYGNALNSIHHYEKVIRKTTKTNTTSTTVETGIISQEEYNNAPAESNDTYTLGVETIDINTVTRIITNYEYEIEQNEAKRKIKILNKEYSSKLEKEFMDLMV